MENDTVTEKGGKKSILRLESKYVFTLAVLPRTLRLFIRRLWETGQPYLAKNGAAATMNDFTCIHSIFSGPVKIIIIMYSFTYSINWSTETIAKQRTHDSENKTLARARTHARTHTHAHTHKHTHIHHCKLARTHARTQTHSHTHTQARARTHARTHAHTQSTGQFEKARFER